MGLNRRLSRRSFFKQTGAVVAALGLTELAISSGISEQAKAYSQALAQSSGRKLALLIGINAYPPGTVSDEQSGRLAGAVSDVALQRELLIHRFGFLPGDIVSLTDKEATREGIYQAVVDHLYNQAQPADTVVFHFSGNGAQVRVDSQSASNPASNGVQRSLIPYDGRLPTESSPVLNDILETELKALLQAVNTKNITTILDAGSVDISVPLSGGLRSRARSVIATGQPPAAFPLIADQGTATESDPFPGVLLRGAATDDVVIERQWDGFNAGAFTYVLTQYLWTAPAPITVARALGRSQETLLRWGGSNQQPTVSGRRKVDLRNPAKTPPIYGTPVLANTRGEGVVTGVSADGKRATLWLGGLPPRALEYLGTTTIMNCGGRRLRIQSREGLTAQARLIESVDSRASIQIGQPILESVRALPKEVNLVVALDSRLERIERVDATSALSSLNFISSTSDTDLPADCLLAKPLAESATTLTAGLNPAKADQNKLDSRRLRKTAQEAQEDKGAGYGLFSLSRSLIPGTLSLQEEAIKPAVSRLTLKLQSLLALKMLRLSENRASSQVPVRAHLEMISPDETLLISRQTFRPGDTSDQALESREGFTPEVPIGSRVRYRLFNDGDYPLYYTLINVDPRERLSAFCPVRDLSASGMAEDKDGTQEIPDIAMTAIAPGSSVAIPSADLDWDVESPPGPIETYVVCSVLPLTRTFNLLLTASANSGGQRINPLPEPLAVVEALLADLNQGDSVDTYTLNVSQWATLNFTYVAV